MSRGASLLIRDHAKFVESGPRAALVRFEPRPSYCCAKLLYKKRSIF